MDRKKERIQWEWFDHSFIQRYRFMCKLSDINVGMKHMKIQEAMNEYAIDQSEKSLLDLSDGGHHDSI